MYVIAISAVVLSVAATWHIGGKCNQKQPLQINKEHSGIGNSTGRESDVPQRERVLLICRKSHTH